jgi:peptide chain release factor 1
LKNKAKALKVLKSRLLELEREKQEAAQSAERRSMVSTGERSQKIRTYNFPQNRVTDHRIRLTLSKLDRIIEGDLDELVTALRTHRQAELLQAAGVHAAAPAFTSPDGTSPGLDHARAEARDVPSASPERGRIQTNAGDDE